MDLLSDQPRCGWSTNFCDINEGTVGQAGAASFNPFAFVSTFGLDLDDTAKLCIFRANLPDVELFCTTKVLIDIDLVCAGKCDFHISSWIFLLIYDLKFTSSDHNSAPSGRRLRHRVLLHLCLAHHFEPLIFTGLVFDIEELVADLGHEVDDAVVTDNRSTVQVDTVDDREADTEVRNLQITGNPLTVCITDDAVDWISCTEAAHMPEVLVDVAGPLLAEWRGSEQRIHFLLELLGLTGTDNMVRNRAQFHQEGDDAEQVIRVAGNSKLLAVDVLMTIGHGVNSAATLKFDRLWNFLAEGFAQLHQEGVGLLDAHREVHGHDFAAEFFVHPLDGVGGAVLHQRDGCLAVDAFCGIVQVGTTWVELVVTIADCVELSGGVSQHGVRDIHGFQIFLVLMQVAHVAVKARDQVQFAGALAFNLLAFGQGLKDRLEHRIVTVDVGAVEAWGVGKRSRQFFRNMSLQLGVGDESTQVVTDNLWHTSGVDGEHLRLVQGVSVFQSFEQVGLATENRAVLSHRATGRCGWLTEVTVEGTPEIGSTPLGTMDERQNAVETMSNHLGTQWVTSVGRVNNQGLTGKVFLFVLFSVDPVFYSLDLFFRVVCQ